jgi:hypothetical protein
MSSPLITGPIAADRISQLRREACAARLVKLARCCRPSTWTRTVRRISEGYGLLRDRSRHQPESAVPCCPPA